MNTTPFSLGVIVARFQVAHLHEGHRALIDHVCQRHSHVLVVLGSARSWATPNNPLSFELRKEMVLEKCGDLAVLELFDNPSDTAWSTELDTLISTHFPEHPATLYGSRDSFLGCYDGHCETCYFEEHESLSGTELRAFVSQGVQTPADFRAGIIHAQQSRAPIPYPVVDIAVIDHKRQMVLLGQKPEDGDTFRFLGGFVDVTDPSYEAAALRELAEEASIDMEHFEDVRCLGSTKIDDWRYRNTPDTLMTTLFQVSYMGGSPVAGDDVQSLHWIPITSLKDVVAPCHLPLAELFLAHLATWWLNK